MDVDSLTDAKLKVKRAYRHIQDVETMVASFTRSDTHRVAIKKDAATGRIKVILESSEKTPVEINLAFGDAIHNLRAALDHTMGRLVADLIPGCDPDHIYFPIHQDRQGTEAALRNAKVGKAMATAIGQKIAAVILDTIKPYGDFDNPIRALNKLDNIDKHRLLLTVNSLAGAHFDGMIGTNRVRYTGMNKVGSNTVLIDSDTNLDGNLQPVFNVLIDEPEFPPYQPLVQTLKNIAQSVSQALEAIERCIL